MLNSPSVIAIRSALELIEGAIRHQPLPEDSGTGTDLGTPVLYFGGDRGSRDTGMRALAVDDDENPANFERPAVIFEVPPKLTDAEIIEVLGDKAGEFLRLIQFKGTDALGWYDRFGLLDTLGIGVDFFETIVGVVETPSFSRSLKKLGSDKIRLWGRRKADPGRSVGLSSLGFERWPPGGPDCYSVRLDGNYRVHLRRSRPDGSWIAENISDHKSMRHG